MVSGGHQALFNGIEAIKNDYDISIAFPAIEDDQFYKNSEDFMKQVPFAHLFPFFKKSPSYTMTQRILSKTKSIVKGFMGLKDAGKNKEGHNDEKMCEWWLKTITPLSLEWTDHINRICSTHHFDIIQVEMTWFVSQILSLPQTSKRIFVHHELGFVRRELESQGKEDNKYINAYRSFVDYNEITLLNMYDSVVTLSEKDSQKLQEHGVSVPVFPSFAIVNSNYQVTSCPISGNRLVFIGPDSHNPNLVGITWFLENCWNRLKTINPNYKLDIIGRWNERRKKDYQEQYPGIEFMGYVEDLGKAIEGAIMIVPITIGSGIRMKILEAATIGIPIVSTSVGAEGLPVKSGEHCFLADTPTEFVDSIVKLQDTSIQKRFVKNASLMIKEHYSKDALRRNRLGIYEKVTISC